MKLRAVAAIVAATGALASLPGCGVIETLTTPSYELSSSQRALVDKTAREGSSGLEGFERIVTNSDFDVIRFDVDENPVPTVRLGEPFTRDDTLDMWTAAIKVSAEDAKMRDILDGRDLQDTASFTPTTQEDGVRVKFARNFVNALTATDETVEFRNPDSRFFGDDIVTVEEMREFFNDSSTELVSLYYFNDDAVNGVCEVDLHFDGDTLKTDAADSCARRIDDSSSDSVIKSIVDEFLD